VDQVSRPDRPGPSGLHRRDLDQDQHGTAQGLGTARNEAYGKGSAPALETMTFLAALRRDRIDAPWLIDGPINGERFRLYVEEVLVPTLRPGDIVILETSAATRGRRFATRSAPPTPGSSSCRSILRTSTPSSSHQAQALPAQGRRALVRRSLQPHRPTVRRLYPAAMRELFRQLRL
jgi:hypothetical protein